MNAEELLQEHYGLIKWHAAREWEGSPLSQDDVISIGHEIFMECYTRWDRERPFGKYFGTCLTYAIKDARFQTPFTMSASSKRRGMKCPEWIDGDELIYEQDCTIMSNVRDEADEPFYDAPVVREAIKKLTPRERKVVGLELLDHTQAEISRILNVSRERVRQIRETALTGLRQQLL